ncbi:copper resistance system multicopper oxidase [Hyphobacterium marinum]|uniref:Copper resistance system multicopper oxidase n=1 Tax=Hyphobacterium marinum TaxID=3116574 RepID=A0ABU7LU24_9PROT|nr:copper resistance system multicopper oxidase [Hyphobacterium sp. Y6023]MEE2565063.1 copper resistance system multicopper oxidase [Hyphobacterium sp. Y6023]
MFSRRHLLKAGAALGGTLAISSLRPAWAQSGAAANLSGIRPLSGSVFDLEVGRSQVNIDGRSGPAITVNGQVPAPLLRWREGDEVTLRVHNRLDTDTSIHWHGILLPNEMDGVPGVTFPGIAPGATFTYRFPLRQAGTYWYHSHSGLQEQMGHYGPIIIEPRGTDPVTHDREYVIVLSDYTFEGPHTVFERLMTVSHTYNYQQRTVGDFFRDASRNGFANAWRDRTMWGRMRMSPTDISDVTAATLDYLINGHGPADNWTGLFEPGERVRLRIINASAMTIFNLRIPGLPMTVVQADGLDVQPVEIDEFQIGVAETYDVVVTPREDRAYTLMAETIDRSGYARATLAPRMGMTAPVPALRERPTLTMTDMAMDHGSMGHDTSTADTVDHAAMGHGPAPASGHDGMDHAAMGHGSAPDHAAMGHGSGHDMPASDTGPQRHDHPMGPGVAGVAERPTNRLHEPGLGLENVAHRALAYTDLRSLEPNPDQRPPGREIEIHLTSNMERYMWSFDGRRFSEVVAPIEFTQGERLRVTFVNDTMMVHPIHLHGMFFEVVNGETSHKPRKHTINVKPGEKLSFDVTPEDVGDWAFHCHLLYHMHAGMFQVVRVQPRANEPEEPDHSGHHGMHH